jgi:23S rRNA pseudouridine2604 synthase
MRNGIKILGVQTKKCTVKQQGEKRFTIFLTQGLNRQIRRMCATLDYKVTSLKRVRIMHINPGNLRTGKWRYFSSGDIVEINRRITNSTKTFDVESMASKIIL